MWRGDAYDRAVELTSCTPYPTTCDQSPCSVYGRFAAEFPVKRPLLEGSGWEMEAWMARWDVLQREGEVIQMDREIE